MSYIKGTISLNLLFIGVELKKQLKVRKNLYKIYKKKTI